MAIEMLAIIVGLSLTLYIIFTGVKNIWMLKRTERRHDYVDALLVGLGTFYLIKIIIRDLVPYLLHTTSALHSGLGYG